MNGSRRLTSGERVMLGDLLDRGGLKKVRAEGVPISFRELRLLIVGRRGPAGMMYRSKASAGVRRALFNAAGLKPGVMI